MKFLNLESKFMYYAFKFGDLVTLNFWFLLCSLPIFTLGASASAMHYVLLGIYRDSLEGGITKNFFKSFRNNFKQATIIWAFYLFILLFIAYDLCLFYLDVLTLPSFIEYVLWGLGIVLLCSMQWAFILQSRYQNTVLETLRNSLLFCIFHFLDTILITVLFCIPFIAPLLATAAIPVIAICGFAVVGIGQTFFYNKVFKMHEKMAEKAREEAEKEQATETKQEAEAEQEAETTDEASVY